MSESSLVTKKAWANGNNYEVGRAEFKIKGITLHHAVTTSISAVDATFQNPSRRASAQYTVSGKEIHQHVSEDADAASEHDNFVTLKVAPTLNLPQGFRLSSTLLYSSRRSIDSRHAHLFATVKANKQLGKKCNVFAEFHDMAGYVTGPWLQLTDLYQNRALSVGATIYPFR